MNSAYFSQVAHVFHGRHAPEEGNVVGYAAIIHHLQLQIPFPEQIAMVCKQNKKYETNSWKVFPEKYFPNNPTEKSEVEALYRHLVFALKYEGVNLLVFSQLTKHYSETQLADLVSIEPEGQYSRRIWFLVEWISGRELREVKRLTKRSYIPLIDEKLQFAVSGIKSTRHLVINNLPGSVDFCPLIRKTTKLQNYISSQYAEKKGVYLNGIRKDVLQRASAFLLLKDSKASFTIEGESPKSKRAARWGQAIGQAGANEITKDELIRLQQIVIENTRFVDMGYRKKGGFIGEHDRTSGEPIPEHISAKWEDLDQLMNGLEKTSNLLLNSEIDAVLCSAVLAFGFVFIHPFEDGNGRIHRYLIHHVLVKKKFAQQGMIFPISAAILDRLDDYRTVLQAYSRPLLDCIEWEETTDHNVRVLNETKDLYRYFDATNQAEFLYDCVLHTIENIIPNEVNYLLKYDAFKNFVDNEFEMPDKTVALLVQFLEQGEGKISKRAREKEFAVLSESEIEVIEENFKSIFYELQ